ncbi:hypothetical protein DKL61_07095 [Gammaproteobacteria bacterium ESL0073]|nr:hypothetical protein DKL61_06930 [Gammaproteobacteria bacterium ESL0073]AWM80130.1 hypothetical protein DKL61_07040 [Gammaproteobacteria bacterium ESL0073]AWM80141.1 hypothetical protein DKL61_07095 [Gammaproteobacteria bacterium ESL0073]
MDTISSSSFSHDHSVELVQLLNLTIAYRELIHDLFLSHSQFDVFLPVFDSLDDQINDLITNMM